MRRSDNGRTTLSSVSWSQIRWKTGEGGGSLKPPPLRRLRRLALVGPSGSLKMADLMRAGMQQVCDRWPRHAAKLEKPSHRPTRRQWWTGGFCLQYVGKASRATPR